MERLKRVFILIFLISNFAALLIQSKSINKISSKSVNERNVGDDVCSLCNTMVPVLRDLIKIGQIDLAVNLTIEACILLKYQDDVVCHQLISNDKEVMAAVAKESVASSKDLCAAAFKCGHAENQIFNWTIKLPDFPKPPIVPPKPPKSGSPTVRILHLSDIHIDFEYQPGALAACDQPLCCRNSSTPNKDHLYRLNDKESRAGYWGDYRRCDVPVWTVEDMFQHISQNEEFDFVYWTGDLPPHNIWNQTRNDQLNAYTHLTNLFLKYFPNKSIYPTLGNHEAAPYNLFLTPNIKQDNISWLYTALADNWSKTGLPSYLKTNITAGAFYTYLIGPGVRLVSLNMNYCPKINFWLLINSTDPLGQLEWLANVLQYSENNNEKVHIIGHINPASCLEAWSENYYKIVNRYESTVTGQFFGHTHYDEFELFYDLEDDTRPTSIAYIAGSVTTFPNLNPGYRIYTVDGIYSNTSWYVLDHESYIMNLTEANLNNKPTYKLEYSAKKEFNMTSLYPNDWSALIEEASQNLQSPLVDKLYNYFYKKTDVIKPCDLECRKTFICHFKQARPYDKIKC